MMTWCIWKRRNDKLWENVFTYLRIVVRLTMKFLHNWEHARKDITIMHIIPTSRLQTHVETWKPPDEGELKCNFDVALFEEEAKFDFLFGHWRQHRFFLLKLGDYFLVVL